MTDPGTNPIQQTRQENDMDRTHELDRPVDQAPQGSTPPAVDWPTDTTASAAQPTPTSAINAPGGWSVLTRKPVAIGIAGAVLAATTFLGGMVVGRATGGSAGTEQGGFGGRGGFGGPQQGGPGQGTMPNQQGQGTQQGQGNQGPGTVPNQQGTVPNQQGTVPNQQGTVPNQSGSATTS
ncbi:hypothetical protein [Solicola sp. PLA-1-18]|uniref:hypothetical protein n=1 Tax=Solicola sp. PLA-1-18 TaxID=3380532 RepID=UPI003B773676